MTYHPFIREAWYGWVMLVAAAAIVSAACLPSWRRFRRAPKDALFLWEAVGHLLRYGFFLVLSFLPGFFFLDVGVEDKNARWLKARLAESHTRPEVQALLRCGSRQIDSDEDSDYCWFGFSLWGAESVTVRYDEQGRVKSWRIGS